MCIPLRVYYWQQLDGAFSNSAKFKVSFKKRKKKWGKKAALNLLHFVAWRGNTTPFFVDSVFADAS